MEQSSPKTNYCIAEIHFRNTKYLDCFLFDLYEISTTYTGEGFIQDIFLGEGKC